MSETSREIEFKSTSSAEALKARLASVGYIADDALAIALHLALRLGRPLLVEGEAGVGKTEVAKALAAASGARLIRLQCHEGLDAASAIYEWNYQRQLLAIKTHERDESADETEERIFSERYLLRRPLLEAITQDEAPVLLIDEIDRADEEFEAYLLEVLSDFQVSVPELGTIRAKSIPHVILTANGTRDLSDALRRRCLYVFVEFPEPERELAILRARVPGAPASGSPARSSGSSTRSGARTSRRSPGSRRPSTGSPPCSISRWRASRATPGRSGRASSASSRRSPTAPRSLPRCSNGWPTGPPPERPASHATDSGSRPCYGLRPKRRSLLADTGGSGRFACFGRTGGCRMRPMEIIFEVTEAVEGGYDARALGHGIHTQGESWDALEAMVQDAVLCHFDDGCAPRVIRLHLVKQEVLAV